MRYKICTLWPQHTHEKQSSNSGSNGHYGKAAINLVIKPVIMEPFAL